MNVLVVAPQWIGDAVMSEPLLACLAERGDRITAAALPSVAPVYTAMPRVAEVIELPFAHGRLDLAARRRLGRRWRGRFDVVYVLPNSIKAALLPWFARIPRRIGYQGEGRPLLLNERQANPPGRPAMTAFYAALAGPVPAAPPVPRLRMSDAALAGALERARVAPPYWVFAPGAEYGPAKCWPAEHYAALARELHATSGAPVLLLGAPKEAELGARIALGAPGACIELAGKTPLHDAMALIAQARGLVSNDSGLMHVAAAFGVAQVAVFGSTSPEHTPPLNDRASVVWLKSELQLECMPCFERTCRYGHYRCLTAVTPERVRGELDGALARVAA